MSKDRWNADTDRELDELVLWERVRRMEEKLAEAHDQLLLLQVQFGLSDDDRDDG